MKIAIVEDEVLIRMYLQETLIKLSQEITEVNVFDDGEVFLAYLKTNKIDVVFMDIAINGKYDGIQTAKKIRELSLDIGVVFMTSYRDSETIQRAKDVGPIGYIIKPVLESGIEAILIVVESYIAQKLNLEIVFAPFIYKTRERELYEDKHLVVLTKQEIICLDVLIKRRDSIVKQDELINTIWPNEGNKISSLRELVHRIRKKLPKLNIKSAIKEGYVLHT